MMIPEKINEHRNALDLTGTTVETILKDIGTEKQQAHRLHRDGLTPIPRNFIAESKDKTAKNDIEFSTDLISSNQQGILRMEIKEIHPDSSCHFHSRNNPIH